MQFMLLIHGDESAMPAAPVDLPYEMGPAYKAYNAALRKAGALVAGERLKPSGTAAVVKLRDGKGEVVDGPFADTKEQLAGYYIIEAADFDAAVDWAGKCPGAGFGAIEVRPIWNATVPG